MNGPSPLTQGERELIFSYAAGVAGCEYVYVAHSEVAYAWGIERGLIERLLENPDTANVGAKLKPLLAFVRKVMLTPNAMTQADADAVFAAGWEEQALQDARQAMEPMTRAAEGVLDRLFLAVGGVGCCVLLTNAEGVPVERRGAAADDETFHRWGLWPGAVWSEAHEGTNGIGTALAEHRPVTIHRDQHFHARNTGLSCVTHPIRSEEHTSELQSH